MSVGICLIYVFLSLLVGSAAAYSDEFIESLGSVRRSSFPAGFKFGTASSAYQASALIFISWYVLRKRIH
ncbi:conserved hypothetical protein [Ricinus communis]|uniref:Beta-glucosidase n=1 Tax=Ricinus communis TaxID=3988 RepID=B9REH9_RICCO|nr:conserved hypothetical protein [Ricinus communis]